jgi:hypothetical protein
MDRPRLSLHRGKLLLRRPAGRVDRPWVDDSEYEWQFTAIPSAGSNAITCVVCGKRIDPDERVWYSVAREQMAHARCTNQAETTIITY